LLTTKYIYKYYIKRREAMKKINKFLISLILIALMTNPVFGYKEYATNNSGAITGDIKQDGQENIDLVNTTKSDQNIILIKQLIEVDAAQFEEQNRIGVHETLIFKNIGDKKFSGTLRTWVPDGLEGLKVGKLAMMMGGSVMPMNAIQNGNIISWNDTIQLNDPLPPMYVVEYVLSAEPEGTLSKSKYYSKKLVYPTLINKVPLSFVLKVTKGSGETITLKDELGSSISSSGNPMDEDNSVLYTWETPHFKEIKIELSKSAIDVSQIGIYLIIGMLIVLVLAYPVVRKKSPKLMEFEEEKSELVAKLEELEKEYASGNMMDEEYEELRNSYQEKLKK
jgi:hypothetical protein